MMLTVFTHIQESVDLGSDKCAVIGGGYLLHKVLWSKSRESTYELVCQNYVDYVLRRFESNALVVFDGYPVGISYQSTESAEQYRRSLLYPRLHPSVEFVFYKTTSIT